MCVCNFEVCSSSFGVTLEVISNKQNAIREKKFLSCIHAYWRAREFESEKVKGGEEERKQSPLLLMRACASVGEQGGGMPLSCAFSLALVLRRRGEREREIERQRERMPLSSLFLFFFSLFIMIFIYYLFYLNTKSF